MILNIAPLYMLIMYYEIHYVHCTLHSIYIFIIYIIQEIYYNITYYLLITELNPSGPITLTGTNCKNFGIFLWMCLDANEVDQINASLSFVYWNSEP